MFKLGQVLMITGKEAEVYYIEHRPGVIFIGVEFKNGDVSVYTSEDLTKLSRSAKMKPTFTEIGVKVKVLVNTNDSNKAGGYGTVLQFWNGSLWPIEVEFPDGSSECYADDELEPTRA